MSTLAKSHDRTLSFESRGERELVMTRVFRASRRAVFDAWTKPELLAQWFGPPSWTLPVCEIDLRVGGAWRFVMQKRGSGERMTLQGTYREIVPGERLVTTESFEPSWYEGESVNTMTLHEDGALTRQVIVVLFESRAARDSVLASNAHGGADQSYDRLETLLGGDGTVEVTRMFNAPLARVWDAWTKDELVRRWWGPVGFTAPVAKMDVREGGVSLVAMRSPDGHDMYSTWAYQEVVPRERFTYVFNLADAQGNSIDPLAMGMPRDFPRDARHVVTLRAHGDQTEMTMVEHGYLSDTLRALSKRGLEECLDKMAALFVA
jgi:uncharacterized protein YndB with AHSA1/START domain